MPFPGREARRSAIRRRAAARALSAAILPRRRRQDPACAPVSARIVDCCEIRILVASARHDAALALLHDQFLLYRARFSRLAASACSDQLRDPPGRRRCADSIAPASRASRAETSRPEAGPTIDHHSTDCSSVRSYGRVRPGYRLDDLGSGTITPSDAAELWTSFSHGDLKFSENPKGRSPVGASPGRPRLSDSTPRPLVEPRLSHLGKEIEEEFFVPVCPSHFTGHWLVERLGPQDILCEACDDGEILWVVVLAVRAASLLKATSSVQCSWFSMLQWARTTSASFLGCQRPRLRDARLPAGMAVPEPTGNRRRRRCTLVAAASQAMRHLGLFSSHNRS